MGRLVRLLVPAILFGCVALASSPALAEVCSTIADNTKRLDCYDKTFPPGPAADSQPVAPTAPTEPVFWYVTSDKSKMDDSQNVYVTLDAEDTIDGKYGSAIRPQLMLRCHENTTAVTIQFGDHFMSDIDGYGTVTYRIDAEPAHKTDMDASTDNSVLGLWNGGTAIPFIKSLFGAKSLVVRAMPFNESAFEATFNVTGAEQSVAKLRAACKW